MALTVMLVDDHPIVRTGLRALFDRREDIDIVGEAASGEEAVALAAHLNPDVVLCDLRLGEGMDGVATTAALRAHTPPPAVIILTTFDHDAEILAAIEAGAAGYLLKDATTDAIATAIRQAASGHIVLAPELAQRVMHRMRQPRIRLTDRELDVLRLLETGATNQQIAKSLYVTEATVKTHLGRIFTKLDADNRSHAVAQARQAGLI